MKQESVPTVLITEDMDDPKVRRLFLFGFNELLDDTNVVVDMAIEENPDIPVFLLGHSMGGFTVSLYGAKYPDKSSGGIITSVH